MRDYFMTTARLGFGIWTADDLEPAKALWGDPQVSKYICAAGVFTEGEIEARLALECENHARYGVQYWPVFDLATGSHVGCCGLRPVSGEADVYELGFHLKPDFWGKGLAVEGARAAIAYAKDTLHARELRAGHNPKNTNSRHVLADKLGFAFTGEEYYPPTGLMHPSYKLEL
ncbi:MAG: GNAT family N-acetyltransferase [Clostridia bacterium]|nr:GNAT family N-acetyltransferase [Clostridia bacterium]